MLTKVLTPDKLDACQKRIGLTRHPMPEKGEFVGKTGPSEWEVMKNRMI